MNLRYLIFTVFVLLLAGFGTSQVFYEIEANNDYVEANATIQLECDPDTDNCPVNNWNLAWNIPENAEVIDVKGTRGEVDSYDQRSREVSIATRNREATVNETILLRYRIDESPESVGNDFYRRNIPLSGFSNEVNSGNISVEGLLSGGISGSKEYSIEENGLVFNTEGSVNMILNTKKGDHNYTETDYFVFNNLETNNSDLAYEAPLGMLEKQPNANKLPVAVLDTEDYFREFGGSSQGRYSSGMIKLRDDLGDSELPVLAHEVVHAINSDVLSWDRTETVYIDEGMAMYVEYLVNRKISDEPVGEIFGEEITYQEDRDGQLYRITVPPRGDKEQLWQYYEEDREDMKYWKNEDNQIREFGYRYSQLMIMNYIAKDEGQLSELVTYLDNVDEEVQSPEEKWRILDNKIDTEPCNYEARERFEECINDINEYEYSIALATPEKFKEDTIEVDRIELETIEPRNSTIRNMPKFDNLNGRLNELINVAKRLSEKLLAEINILLSDSIS